MPQSNSLAEQAEQSLHEARGHAERRDAAAALAGLERAVLLYAEADVPLDQPDFDATLREERARACRAFAQALSSETRFAEAANIYQEATDLYGSLDGPEWAEIARECARALLQCIAKVRAQPQERLHLLIAHHERNQRQLAMQPGTETEQAECSAHIARIYQRRDRPEESADRYREAIALYNEGEMTAANRLAAAECHHRLAALLELKLARPQESIGHYRAAIELYQEHEQFVHGCQQSLGLCRAALRRVEFAANRTRIDGDRFGSRE